MIRLLNSLPSFLCVRQGPHFFRGGRSVKTRDAAYVSLYLFLTFLILPCCPSKPDHRFSPRFFSLFSPWVCHPTFLHSLLFYSRKCDPHICVLQHSSTSTLFLYMYFHITCAHFSSLETQYINCRWETAHRSLFPPLLLSCKCKCFSL